MNDSGVGVNAFGTSAAEYNSLDNSFRYGPFDNLDFPQPDSIMGNPSQLRVNPTGNALPNQPGSTSVNPISPSHHPLNTASHGMLAHCTLPFPEPILKISRQLTPKLHHFPKFSGQHSIWFISTSKRLSTSISFLKNRQPKFPYQKAHPQHPCSSSLPPKTSRSSEHSRVSSERD
jgi:hypothetical protein